MVRATIISVYWALTAAFSQHGDYTCAYRTVPTKTDAGRLCAHYSLLLGSLSALNIAHTPMSAHD
jgi:hypothetical protein